MAPAKKPAHPEEEVRKEKEEEEKQVEGPVPSLASFLSSPVMNTVLRILLNGKESCSTMRPFLRHEELVQSMFYAYNQENQDAFLSALRTYLELSALNLPHGGYSHHVDPIIGVIKGYCQSPYCGFHALGGYILNRVKNAPA